MKIDTQTATKVISKTKMAIAVAFLGVAAVAAAGAGLVSNGSGPDYSITEMEYKSYDGKNVAISFSFGNIGNEYGEDFGIKFLVNPASAVNPKKPLKMTAYDEGFMVNSVNLYPKKEGNNMVYTVDTDDSNIYLASLSTYQGSSYDWFLHVPVVNPVEHNSIGVVLDYEDKVSELNEKNNKKRVVVSRDKLNSDMSNLPDLKIDKLSYSGCDKTYIEYDLEYSNQGKKIDVDDLFYIKYKVTNDSLVVPNLDTEVGYWNGADYNWKKVKNLGGELFEESLIPVSGADNGKLKIRVPVLTEYIDFIQLFGVSVSLDYLNQILEKNENNKGNYRSYIEKNVCYGTLGLECQQDWDCNDFSPCTNDLCQEGECSNPPYEASFGLPCNDDDGICQADGSCTPSSTYSYVISTPSSSPSST